MIGKLKKNSSFIGPKAIFDPNFVPPKVLYREKEEISLAGILNDSFLDKFSINVLYQGIKGIGKKVIINKVLSNLQKKEDSYTNYFTVYLDCMNKDADELMYSLLGEINTHPKINIEFNSLKFQFSHLWSRFKIACKKVNNNILLVLNNVEDLNMDLFKKFLLFGKKNKISILSTVNKVFRSNIIDLLNDFDIKEKLSYFSYKQLYLILKQRAEITFPFVLDKELIEYVTDLIYENYVPVPGKGIDIYREIYPQIQKKESNNKKFLSELCQNQFDQIANIDDFYLLNYLSESNLLSLIFIDNLANHLRDHTNYYVNLDHLKEMFELACESLDYEKNQEEFSSILQNIVNIGLLTPSRKSPLKSLKTGDPLQNRFYFSNISPEKLQMIIDTLFNQSQF